MPLFIDKLARTSQYTIAIVLCQYSQQRIYIASSCNWPLLFYTVHAGVFWLRFCLATYLFHSYSNIVHSHSMNTAPVSLALTFKQAIVTSRLSTSQQNDVSLHQNVFRNEEASWENSTLYSDRGSVYCTNNSPIRLPHKNDIVRNMHACTYIAIAITNESRNYRFFGW